MLFTVREPVRSGFRRGELQKFILGKLSKLKPGQSVDVSDTVTHIGNLYAAVTAGKQKGVFPKNTVAFVKKGYIYLGLEER